MTCDHAFQDSSGQLEQQPEPVDQALAELCGWLARLDVDLVSIAFDGCSDSGVLQDPIATRNLRPVPLPPELQQATLDVAAELLPTGWDVNHGSSGELVLVVCAVKAIRHHRWRSAIPPMEGERVPSLSLRED